MSDKASDLFWSSFSGTGGLMRGCVCGRLHFADREDAGSWCDGELEGLRSAAVEKPLSVIPVDADAVSSISIDGVEVVYGCTCGSAAKYEKLFLSIQPEILRFYRAVAAKQARSLAATERQMDGL